MFDTLTELTSNSSMSHNASSLAGLSPTNEAVNQSSELPSLLSHTAQPVAFVDSRLDNVDDLVASLTGASVYLLADQTDGVHYIADVLSQHQLLDSPVDSVHIFAHGQAGAMQLGATTLTADSLNGYADTLATWGNSQTNDLLVYGCEVGKGALGSAFLNQLAALTGADIQASNDVTGSAALGGDWDLEVLIGSIESGLAISEAGQVTYQGTLANPVITSNGGDNTATIVLGEGETFVTDVETTGANGYSEGNGLEYYFNAGDDAYLFDIDVDTGAITFKNAPDYENPTDADGNNVYFANVLAIDWSGQADSQFLAIVVQDVDEPGSAPVITSNGGEGYAYKEVEEGTSFVLDMSVTDVDGQSENNGITYSINAGEDADLFEINADTGALFFKTRPDYENPDDADGNHIYGVNVLVGDSTGRYDSQYIEIAVTDEAGDEPLDVAVPEETTAVSDLPVTDAYGGSISYTLSGADAALFEVSTTGELTFKAAPDFENPADADGDNVYRLTLSGLNSVNIATPREVSVTVEPGPSQPLITSNGGGDTAVINLNEGMSVVTDVETTGANGYSEGNGLMYSINAGDDADLFDIDATTGVISFKTAPDFENPADADSDNVYFINVLVLDPTWQADSQFLSIVVKNVAEGGSAPVITSNGGEGYAFTQIQENQTLSLDVEATDADGDSEGNGLTYSINAGEDAHLFEINPQTGVISFNAAFDYENPLDHDHNNIYRINVLATDSTGKAVGQFLEIAVTNLVSVYLLGGQSNMAGETTDTDDLTGSPQANPLSAVQIWQPGVGEFVDLRSGFNSNYGDGDGFGAELGFGHALEAARASGAVDTEEIYLVKYAIGATSLAENWSVDGNNNTYDQFNAWVGGALSHLTNAGIGYDIEGMLWMQGEHDTIDANRAADYQANLTGFISDVRDRYGANLDFVIGRLHEELTPYYYTWADEVRTAQENVADADANAYWVNTDDFAVNPVDDVHFDSFGQLALGQAFADVFIA
ncbi:MAG: DUF4347 domain-containing protein [Phormidesmis sp.]